MADNPTTKLGLNRPDLGDSGWDTKLNDNADVLEKAFGGTGGTHAGDPNGSVTSDWEGQLIWDTTAKRFWYAEAAGVNNQWEPIGAPTASMMLWAGAAAGVPSGWLICDGASVLRSTYAALFSVIGTAFGSVDGTHFNLPDLQGRVPFGVDSGDSDFDARGKTGGVKSHDHSGETQGIAHGGVEEQAPGTGIVSIHSNHDHNIDSDDHVPPYVAIYYIIRT